MAHILPPAQLQNLCRRYEAGEPVSGLAVELAVTHKVVKRLLSQAGVSVRSARAVYAMRRGFSDDDLAGIHARYLAGESSVELARGIGCHSSTLRNIFARNGLVVRDTFEAHRLSSGKIAPELHKARTEAAHAAVRGRSVPAEEKGRRALSRERCPPAMTEAELLVHGALESAGFNIQRERACGPYNIDFAVGHAVAVECFGGGWHASGHHAARHEKRTRYLLDAGWHVVIVWLDGDRGGLWVRRLKDEISDLQSAGRNPSALREYRVIWGDGELVARCADADDFPTKRPGELRRDSASGRYYRAR